MASGLQPVLGLSPLARGNRFTRARSSLLHGPIPARAGQPPPSALRHAIRGAYPRSRGATVCTVSVRPAVPGLSPLARGNLGDFEADVQEPGPIPARAGQPSLRHNPVAGRRAYPRSRGATHTATLSDVALAGLSPLARGNHVDLLGAVAGVRPIPARAGQPGDCLPSSRLQRAYPRSRGATASPSKAVPCPRGLSPLARGNLLYLICCHTRKNRQINAKF